MKTYFFYYSGQQSILTMFGAMKKSRPEQNYDNSVVESSSDESEDPSEGEDERNGNVKPNRKRARKSGAGKNKFKAKWLLETDVNGDIIGNWARQVDDHHFR